MFKLDISKSNFNKLRFGTKTPRSLLKSLGYEIHEDHGRPIIIFLNKAIPIDEIEFRPEVKKDPEPEPEKAVDAEPSAA